ncbi:MAG: zinc/iron permease [uncultured bacterium]|nr:MAG: zinc/iron permease [uncultured bacterium]HBD05727.1 ZIP family metal transporter [Candidatus Uhrbacteria bacterium]
MTLIYIIISALIISLFSLSGIVLLFFKEKILHKFLLALVSLSAGAMLGTSFFHLLPEALSKNNNYFQVFMITLSGFVLFFILEQFLRWHHCHSASHHGHEAGYHCHVKPAARLVLLSDTVHNFIDGLILSASFIVSPVLGATTAIAIALHEVPQEIGDFGVMLYSGVKKKRALLLNFFSALSIVAGGVVGYLLSQSIALAVEFLIPFAAGSFLYISATDLLPELKHDEKINETALHFFAFIAGIAIVTSLVFIE